MSSLAQTGSDPGALYEDATIEVSLGEQRLRLRSHAGVLLECPVSTATNGAGENEGSFCTPRGWHRICEKFGEGAADNAVFVGRRPTGELYHPSLRAGHPDRDWILTRVLWLSGLEPGRNCGGDVDTRARYIYLHGCPDDVELGRPGSHGCIRVSNADIVRLYDLVEVGTRVLIG